MPQVRKLNRYISDKINWTPSERKGFFEQIIFKRYRPGTIVYHERDVYEHLFFVNRGSLCSVSHDDSLNPVVIQFAFENELITDLVSFVNRKPAKMALQSLEYTECIVIPKSAILWLYDNVEEGYKLARICYQNLYYRLALINRLNYLKTPEDRYRLMIEIYPKIRHRVTQRLQSSFIRIDPAYFTRLNLSTMGGRKSATD